jgi:CheY-like chemotaxis protein
VESNVGVGSTFTLYLPMVAVERDGAIEGELAPTPLMAPEPEVPAQTAEELRGKKVLLVDDDPRNLFAVTSLLERRDIQVVCASTAQEGITLLNETPDIDLVLMDIMLPGVDGYEATRQIRAQPEHSRMPIIALTAKAMPGDREKCLEAGCTAFVAKPVDVNRLILTMKEALGVGAPS